MNNASLCFVAACTAPGPEAAKRPTRAVSQRASGRQAVHDPEVHAARRGQPGTSVKRLSGLAAAAKRL